MLFSFDPSVFANSPMSGLLEKTLPEFVVIGLIFEQLK